MPKVIKAHITGTVWKIEVKAGDAVEEGTVVAILESMKMEMPVESEDEGAVETIHVKEGQPWPRALTPSRRTSRGCA
jgi:acetyl-CoA carboxylase biotin carboxyl carrier protein